MDFSMFGKKDPVGGRSVFRNLFISMLTFGAVVGCIFPIFAKNALQTDRAYHISFIAMCMNEAASRQFFALGNP